jgi:hypothetical protein
VAIGDREGGDGEPEGTDDRELVKLNGAGGCAYRSKWLGRCSGLPLMATEKLRRVGELLLLAAALPPVELAEETGIDMDREGGGIIPGEVIVACCGEEAAGIMTEIFIGESLLAGSEESASAVAADERTAGTDDSRKRVWECGRWRW